MYSVFFFVSLQKAEMDLAGDINYFWEAKLDSVMQDAKIRPANERLLKLHAFCWKFTCFCLWPEHNDLSISSARFDLLVPVSQALNDYFQDCTEKNPVKLERMAGYVKDACRTIRENPEHSVMFEQHSFTHKKNTTLADAIQPKQKAAVRGRIRGALTGDEAMMRHMINMLQSKSVNCVKIVEKPELCVLPLLDIITIMTDDITRWMKERVQYETTFAREQMNRVVAEDIRKHKVDVRYVHKLQHVIDVCSRINVNDRQQVVDLVKLIRASYVWDIQDNARTTFFGQQRQKTKKLIVNADGYPMNMLSSALGWNESQRDEFVAVYKAEILDHIFYDSRNPEAEWALPEVSQSCAEMKGGSFMDSFKRIGRVFRNKNLHKNRAFYRRCYDTHNCLKLFKFAIAAGLENTFELCSSELGLQKNGTTYDNYKRRLLCNLNRVNRDQANLLDDTVHNTCDKRSNGLCHTRAFAAFRKITGRKDDFEACKTLLEIVCPRGESREHKFFFQISRNPAYQFFYRPSVRPSVRPSRNTDQRLARVV